MAASGSGCSAKPSIPAAAYEPERIIRNFNDMREHEIVSWAWIRRGFMLKNCRTITIEPLLDACRPQEPSVSRRIKEGLESIFKDQSSQSGELSVKVSAALLEVKHKPGWIKKWFTDFDEFPYIEMELLISEAETGLPLVKIVHFRRDTKSLDAAVSNILDDFRMFFTTAL